MASMSAKISFAYSRTLHMVPSNPWSYCQYISPFQNSGCDDRHRIYDWYGHTAKRRIGKLRCVSLLSAPRKRVSAPTPSRNGEQAIGYNGCPIFIADS